MKGRPACRLFAHPSLSWPPDIYLARHRELRRSCSCVISFFLSSSKTHCLKQCDRLPRFAPKVVSPIYFVSKICPLEPCAGNLGIRFKFLERVNSPNSRRIPFGESERGKKGEWRHQPTKRARQRPSWMLGSKAVIGSRWIKPVKTDQTSNTAHVKPTKFQLTLLDSNMPAGIRGHLFARIFAAELRERL